MSRFWILGLALVLGYLSSTALGQYSGQVYQAPQSGNAFPIRQSILESLPMVPQKADPTKLAFNASQPNTYGIVGPYNGQYQLVGNQSQVYSGPAEAAASQMYSAPTNTHVPMQQGMTQHAVAPMPNAPPAVPTAPMQAQGNWGGQPSCQTCAPQVNSQVMATAPNCASCGPAPVSQYAHGFSYAPAVPQHRIGVGTRAISKPWFFGASALIFNRIDNKNIPLAYFDADYATKSLTTRDARQRAAGGIETTVGRYFNCGKNAIAFTYWGIFPDDQNVTRARATAGDYRSQIPFTYIDLPTATAYDWYDTAFTHTLCRSFEYHNVEVNLLGFAAGGAARNFNRSTLGTLFSGTRHRGGSACGYCGGAGCNSCATGCSSCGTACGGNCKPVKYATGPCNLVPGCGSRLNLTWIAGLRYFRFNDGLCFASSRTDTVVNAAADDLYYAVDTTNDLIGFQAGGRVDYCLRNRVNLYGLTKVGIYNNRSTLDTGIGTNFASGYLNDTRTVTNPFQGQDYQFDETKDSVAFLSELGTGFGVRFSPKWTGTFGYRAVIASGVAVATDNVRQTFDDYADVRDFNNYGTLILHGFNLGAQYNF